MKKSIFLFFAAILCAMTANAQLYLRGGFNGWGSSDEFKFVSNVCEIELDGATTYEFKIADSGWGTNYGGAHTFTATATKALSSGGGNMKITTTIPGTYKFEFVQGTKKLTVTYPEVPAPHDITVRAKLPATWTSSTITAWVWTSENASGTPVTAEKDGDYYKITKNAGALYVIFRNGADWNGDKNQTVDLCYTEDVCLQLNQSGTAKATATVIDCGAVSKDITVKAVVPGAWENTITAWVWPTGGEGKEVTPTKDGNWYVVTENCIELNVIFKNGTGWNGDANQTVNIEGVSENICYQISALNKEGGKCSVTEVDCEAAIEPEAKPVDVYTIVGAETLVGTAWDLNNTENDMTKQGDGSYVLVKENVELATTGTYEYKVVKNRGWDWKGVNEGNNLTLTGVDVDGTYNVTFTLNKELNALTASLELVEAKKVIPECYVAGDESLTGQNWNGKSIQMIYDEATEVYTATLTAVPAGTHNMKVVYGGEWLGFDHLATPAPANVKEGDDKKIQFTLAEAGDVTVTYHATNGIGLTGNFAVPETKYYIAGTENLTGFDWKENGLQLTKDGDLYKHTFSELAAGVFEFKVTNGTWTDPWGFGNLSAAYEEVSEGVDGEGNPNGNIKFTTEEAKNITVIFDPATGKITIEGLTPYVAPLTYTVTVPAGTEKCYIAGPKNDWSFQEMTATANANEFTITIAGAKETDGYKYACQASWDYVEKKEDGNDLDANRTWSANDVVAKWGVPPTYTIVGATAITGANWETANEDNKMTKEGEVYTLTKTNLQLEAGDYEYKVAKNGAWGDGQYPAEGNQKVTIEENGVYTIVYTYTVGTSLTAEPTKTGDYTPVQAVYTVAGDLALCGSEWKADDADNDMTDNGDGTFTWTKTGVKLTSDAGFKVVKNHDFGVAYPAENWVIKIADYDGAAIYTVTITFTESSKDIAVTLTKTGETTPPVITYVLMGVNGDWDNGIALTQNPDNADEYVLENQVIIKATDAVKVVTLTDGTATAWCANVDTWSNATYTADAEGNIVLEDGIYTFYFKKNDALIYINQTGYVRNVTNKYGTICLPYASASTTGATFYRVAGKEEGSKVYLESVDALEAGVPYIFEKTASQIKVVYTGEKATTAGSANGLVGTFNNETEVAVDYYILKNDEFCPSNGNAKVNANRAYLIMEDINGGAPQQMPGRRYIGMSVQGENEATGLDNITNGENTTIKLIENGQLIIIRNGEKFNAQGQKL